MPPKQFLLFLIIQFNELSFGGKPAYLFLEEYEHKRNYKTEK